MTEFMRLHPAKFHTNSLSKQDKTGSGSDWLQPVFDHRVTQSFPQNDTEFF